MINLAETLKQRFLTVPALPYMNEFVCFIKYFLSLFFQWSPISHEINHICFYENSRTHTKLEHCFQNVAVMVIGSWI